MCLTKYSLTTHSLLTHYQRHVAAYLCSFFDEQDGKSLIVRTITLDDELRRRNLPGEVLILKADVEASLTSLTSLSSLSSLSSLTLPLILPFVTRFSHSSDLSQPICHSPCVRMHCVTRIISRLGECNKAHIRHM